MNLKKWLQAKAVNWLSGDLVNGPSYGSSSGGRYLSSSPKTEFNSIVTSVLGVMARSFIEPPLAIFEDGDETPDKAHAAVQLIANPSDYVGAGRLSGLQLLKATVTSRGLEGNAYWHKMRAGRGQVVGLEFLRFDQCRPVAIPENVTVLSHYEVRGSSTQWGGMWARVEKEDVVHFADGINPVRPLEGMSPVMSCIREVCTDNEAVRFMEAIVRNPTLGVMVTPADATVIVNHEDATMMAEYMEQRAGGMNAGKTIVPTTPWKTERFGLSPEEMALDKILRLPEQRITACFGVPAIVVGLGAGLERSTFANFKEAREAFTETVMIPLWREIAADLQRQLFVPDFGGKPNQRIGFDTADVRALQDDENELYKRVSTGWNVGMLTLGQCYSMLGQELPTGFDENERKTAPATVEKGDPGEKEEDPIKDPQKAWVDAMAKKWQDRASA